MVENDPIAPTDSSQLEYTTLKSQVNQVSKTADPTSNSRQQHVENISLVLNNESVDNSNIVIVQFAIGLTLGLELGQSKIL